MTVLINVILSWWMWRIATAAFDQDQTALGWIGIALSALNFAVAMAELF
jgi:hypothetical protein